MGPDVKLSVRASFVLQQVAPKNSSCQAVSWADPSLKRTALISSWLLSKIS
jgi:hypothetical protein